MITKNIVKTLTPGSPGVQAAPYVPAVPGLFHQAYYASTGVLAGSTSAGSFRTATPSGAPGFVELTPQNAPVNPLQYADILRYLTGRESNPPVPEGQRLYTYRKLCVDIPYMQVEMMCATSSYGQFWYTGPMPALAASAAIPTIPNSVATEYNLGWNSCAVSVHSLAADGSALFGASAGALGAYVGLTATLTPKWADFTHAILFSHNTATLYEFGVAAGVPLGPYLATDVFAIRRIGGRVEYIKNSVTLATSLYYSSGEVYLGTMLYSAGDSTI